MLSSLCSLLHPWFLLFLFLNLLFVLSSLNLPQQRPIYTKHHLKVYYLNYWTDIIWKILEWDKRFVNELSLSHNYTSSILNWSSSFINKLDLLTFNWSSFSHLSFLSSEHTISSFICTWNKIISCIALCFLILIPRIVFVSLLCRFIICLCWLLVMSASSIP